MAEAPKNPGSLAGFESAGNFATTQEAQEAYFEQLDAYRLGQAALLGVDLEDLHAMRFTR